MGHKVINEFKDSADKNYYYAEGELYPRKGYKPTKKRIEELSKVHPKYKCAFIKLLEKKAENEKKPAKK